MAKTRKQKEEQLQQVVRMIGGAKGAVLADHTGLTVKESQELRKNLRAEGIEYEAVKKSLFKKALAENKLDGKMIDGFGGSIGLATSDRDEVSPAKIVVGFAKTHEKMSVVGGIMNSLLIDATAVKSLAKLPSKQELLGQVVGTIAAPVSGFVRVLAGNLRGFVQVLSAMSKKS